MPSSVWTIIVNCKFYYLSLDDDDEDQPRTSPRSSSVDDDSLGGGAAAVLRPPKTKTWRDKRGSNIIVPRKIVFIVSPPSSSSSSYSSEWDSPLPSLGIKWQIYDQFRLNRLLLIRCIAINLWQSSSDNLINLLPSARDRAAAPLSKTTTAFRWESTNRPQGEMIYKKGVADNWLARQIARRIIKRGIY